MHKTVEVVSDSAASLTREMLLKHEISVVPIWLQIGEQSFKEGVDITVEEFYRRLDGPDMPSTSSPPPSEFMDIYRNLARKAKDILSVHVTAKGSSTCQVAALAAESVPEASVTVYDSGTVSMGIGFLALEAAKGALQGLSKDEIVAKLDSIKSRIYAFVAIPTLKYLRKSGRVSRGKAMLASLLSIKPVLEIKDGVISVVDQVRTFSKALTRVLELAHNVVGNRPAIVAVMHANAPETAKTFASQVKKKLNIKEMTVGEAGPALAIHGGPGMIGIVLYTS